MPEIAPAGYLTLDQVVNPRRFLLLTEGEPDTGKTEFLFSAPTKHKIISIDRGLDGCLLNPNPPAARKKAGVYVKLCKPPLEPTQANQATKDGVIGYLDAFKEIKGDLYAALADDNIRTVSVDTDSDFFRLQTLAEFGKISQIPPMMRENLYAAKRGMYLRCWDSNKIVIMTNKLVPEWKGAKNPDGTPKVDDKGKEVRYRTENMVSAGFDEDHYLWQVRIRHLWDKEKGQRGLRVMRCKHNSDYEGLELWDNECCFAGLVECLFPNLPLSTWGL